MLMSLEPTVSEPIGRARPARSHDHLLAAGSLITQLMIVLDMTIIAVALPSMQADLGLTDSQRPWAVTAYTLANGGLVLFGGRLTTILGIRRSYWIGQTGFAAASLIAGLASSFPVLVGARTAQGAFAALLGPTALSLLNTAFPDGPRRRRIFALFGATAGVGAAAGLLIGGALTDWFSWRWSLYVNVLIAAIGFLIGLRGLPTSKSRHDGPAFSDLLGLVLGCGACFSAVFGLDRAEQTSWTSATTIGWLSAAAVLAVAFLLRERVATAPTLPLWIVSQPARAASYAAVATVGAAQMGGAVYLTYYLQNHFGYSPLRTGIAFLPMIGALVVTAPLAGQYLLRRLGTRVVLPLGIAIEGAAFLMLSRIETTSTYAGAVVPGIIVLGIGIGCIMPAAINTGTRGVPGPHVGLASAVVTVGQQIGASLGVALLATYSTSRADNYVTDHADTTRAAAGQALQQAQAAHQPPVGRLRAVEPDVDRVPRALVDGGREGPLLRQRLPDDPHVLRSGPQGRARRPEQRGGHPRGPSWIGSVGAQSHEGPGVAQDLGAVRSGVAGGGELPQFHHAGARSEGEGHEARRLHGLRVDRPHVKAQAGGARLVGPRGLRAGAGIGVEQAGRRRGAHPVTSEEAPDAADGDAGGQPVGARGDEVRPAGARAVRFAPPGHMGVELAAHRLLGGAFEAALIDRVRAPLGAFPPLLDVLPLRPEDDSDADQGGDEQAEADHPEHHTDPHGSPLPV